MVKQRDVNRSSERREMNQGWDQNKSCSENDRGHGWDQCVAPGHNTGRDGNYGYDNRPKDQDRQSDNKRWEHGRDTDGGERGFSNNNREWEKASSSWNQDNRQRQNNSQYSSNQYGPTDQDLGWDRGGRGDRWGGKDGKDDVRKDRQWGKDSYHGKRN